MIQKRTVLKKLIDRYQLLIMEGEDKFWELSEEEIGRQFVNSLFVDVFGWPIPKSKKEYWEEDGLVLWILPGNPLYWDSFRLKAETRSKSNEQLIVICNFENLALFYRGEQQIALGVEQYLDWPDILEGCLHYSANWKNDWESRLLKSKNLLTARTFKVLEDAWQKLKTAENSRTVFAVQQPVSLFFCLLFYRLAEELTLLAERDSLRRLIIFYRKDLSVPVEKGKFYRLLLDLFNNFAFLRKGKLFSALPADLTIAEENLVAVCEQFSRLRFSPFQISLLPQFYQTIFEEGQRLEKGMNPRKARGVFYTPPYLADFLVRETLEPELSAIAEQLKTAGEKGDKRLFLAGLERLKCLNVLDPACGTGVFLLSALKFLLCFYQTELEPLINRFFSLAGGKMFKQQNAILGAEDLPVGFLGQLSGVDLDGLALELARQSLVIQLFNQLPQLPAATFLPKINLKRGNSLISLLPGGKFKPDEFREELFFNRSEQFPGLFGQSKTGRTIVLANPPWGGDLSCREGQLILECYGGVCRFPLDSYKLFLQLGMEILQKGDRMGFLVPSTLLNQIGYREMRERLLYEGKLLAVVELGEGVFSGVKIPCCLLVWERGKLENQIKLLDLIGIKDEQKRQSILVEPAGYWRRVEQDNYLLAPNLNIYTGSEQCRERLFSFLDSTGYPILAEIAETITRGIETGNNRVFLVSEQEMRSSGLQQENFLPCFGGGQILPYHVLTPDKYLLTVPEAEGKERESVLNWLNKRDEYFAKLAVQGQIKRYIPLRERYKVKQGIIHWFELNSPRFLLTTASQIVIRQTSDRPIAAPNDGKLANLSNVQNIIIKKYCDFEPCYLIALLNSSLLRFYYQNLVPEKGRTFAEVKRQNLERIPLFPAAIKEQEGLKTLVRRIRTKKISFYTHYAEQNNGSTEQEIRFLERCVDSYVYHLYGLKKEEIDLVEAYCREDNSGSALPSFFEVSEYLGSPEKRND